eukprot:gb/GEZN01000017.1/.p1 GENE.gb/GEZN01000017.1/~~gb/GEZN01000017.1/.p1  ORF type:complete len:4783 (-),score=794.37 gb/GEZN01000017.1/:118-14466(-)
MSDPPEAASSALLEGDAKASGIALVDAELLASLKNYLSAVCPSVLTGDPERFRNATNEPESEDILRIFAGDAEHMILIVHKTRAKTASDGTDRDLYQFDVDLKASAERGSQSNEKSTSIALIKVSSAALVAEHLAAQLLICQIRDMAPFETILSYVRQCYLPYSRALMERADRQPAEAKGEADVAVLRGVNDKLRELEVELLRSTQSIDIPHVTLEVHRRIADFVAKCEAESKTPKVEDFGDVDDVFLNELQQGLNAWKSQILSLTTLDRDVQAGNTLEEIHFWLRKEKAVHHIYDQIGSVPVALTFQVLKENKRFWATTGFTANVGLMKERTEDKVHQFSNLLRDFPIKRLLTAPDFAKLMDSVRMIFQHLKQIRRVPYPLDRAIGLTHTLSRDLADRIKVVMDKDRKAMDMEFKDFLEHYSTCQKLFEAWDYNLENFMDDLREIKRKRHNENIIALTDRFEALDALKQRMRDVYKIRKAHRELRAVVTATMSSDPVVRDSALKQIDAAYAFLRGADVLNISPEGNAEFARAQDQYKNKIDQVEGELEDKVRELLGQAKDDANEMFRICAKFNALFVRPRIQRAIREYQEQLIATVKKDIDILQEKFKSQYQKSEARRMSRIHDVPPVSGAIIWNRQIQRQLERYMQRVADVLGKEWVHHVEGKKLQEECQLFQSRLDTQKLFKSWVISTKDIEVFDLEARVFRVLSQKTERETRTVLNVNFDKSMVHLFKEVRSLLRLGMKMPVQLVITADEARLAYPSSMQLEEAITSYTRTCNQLREWPQLAPLAAGHMRRMQDHLSKGAYYQWDSEALKKYVEVLNRGSSEFRDHVDELITLNQSGTRALHRLRTCPATHEALQAILDEIQSVVDHVDKRGFSNLSTWVNSLDEQVEELLTLRLESILDLWGKSLEVDPSVARQELLKRQQKLREMREKRQQREKKLNIPKTTPFAEVRDAATDLGTGGEDERRDEEKDEEELKEEQALEVLKYVRAESIRHKIHIRNSTLQMEPPLEYARLQLTQELQSWLAVVCELPRLKFFWTSGQSQAPGVDDGHQKDVTFRSVLNKVKKDVLRQCMEQIEAKVSAAAKYGQTWLRYQALWDMDLNTVIDEVGDDLALWQELLVSMRRSRTTFDNSDKEQSFGPIVVEYGTVQEKVNNRYDRWHKQLLSRFGQMLAVQMSQLFKDLQAARAKLEDLRLDFGSTSEIVESVTLLQNLRKKAPEWKSTVETHLAVEKLLQRQRYLFPSDWLFGGRLQGEYKAFDQILSRKLAKMEEEAPALQAHITREDELLTKRVGDFCADWKQKRPVQGDLPHGQVHNTLGLFQSQMTRLSEDVQRLAAAKRALDMAAKEEKRLEPVAEELKGLQEVWNTLGKAWDEIDQYGGLLFSVAKPLEIRRGLDKLRESLLALPNQMRTYLAYDHLRDTIKDYLGLHHVLSDLSSGLLRPKHQKQVLGILKLSKRWSELTVATLWAADLKRHVPKIREILIQAQGEGALEEFLSEVAATWEQTKFDTVDYRSKTYLIRNWDKLFQQLQEQLGDLSNMKNSPFFAAFERTAMEWEEKLNLTQAILDVFIDVQRRWVYLEGIFTNSQDVQVQLAYQFKRFKTFDRDFVRLMREVKREEKLEYWVKPEQHLLTKLEGYADTLNGIQKALGDYLEKQRSAFPRFYFVGDEDLLEIIGNAKNPVKLIRHLPKMFAGLFSLSIGKESSIIQAMISREGEEVPFVCPVDVAAAATIHEWLSALEYQMRATLVQMLGEAMSEQDRWSQSGMDEVVATERFFAFVDKFPAQIVNVAVQVGWTARIEHCLKNNGAGLEAAYKFIVATLHVLAGRILEPGIDSTSRRKYEQLITELIHQRDVTRKLFDDSVDSLTDFSWLRQLRYYFNKEAKLNPNGTSTALEIRISRSKMYYGWEYLGVSEKLVQTALTDRCFLTMTEALHMRLGGNPYGPAGTGKTVSVLALGALLGRFTLVFNCDEAFDFHAMGRIFVGLCQVGAWGCFDEFNRLEERILSAVSQQIQTIQTGLRERSNSIVLLGKSVSLNHTMGIFVTMNPTYAGRSNLPDNLKQLFRGIAMMEPQYRDIAQVTLFSQGFRTAEQMAGKVVMQFSLCKDQLSSQAHYDFGLRGLKNVLRSAGGLKLQSMATLSTSGTDQANAPKTEKDWFQLEQDLLVQSMYDTVVPKLVSEDVPLFQTLMAAVFPTANTAVKSDPILRAAISQECWQRRLLSDGPWVEKLLQFNKILGINHGVILVGPSGSGKTTAWQVLRAALEATSKRKIDPYVLDPKSISKTDLYGVLDPTTLEWTDGVFTHLLRKIIDNQRGERQRDHWIIFDGDVDPEWAENLNSVLDDSKLLTLPSGERLELSPNVRIIFETQDLEHATLATVSRCGMVWCSEEVVSTRMLLDHLLQRLKYDTLDSVPSSVCARWRDVQAQAVESVRAYFGISANSLSQRGGSAEDGGASELGDTESNIKSNADDDASNSFVTQCLSFASSTKYSHVMPFTRGRVLETLLPMLKGGIGRVIEYNDNHSDFPLDSKQTEAFMTKHLMFSLLWALGGSLSLKDRESLGKDFTSIATMPLPDPASGVPLIDYEVRVESQEWESWDERVEDVDMEPQAIVKPDVVIGTVDTIRHAYVIGSWLDNQRPLILCGPPGSGKSMTLASVLRGMDDVELVTLNFSSTTTPDLILRTLAHYCKTKRTTHGMVMSPVSATKRLVIFCDEINLPANDAYQTQAVITFLRQLTEQGGFWSGLPDLQFIKLERVQFIGACNPPTDAGRVDLSARFLRHTPLLFVDFPGIPSLRTIYGSFNRALLKLIPTLRTLWEALTEAMIDVYSASQGRFTTDAQAHYVYSPRELTRWVRAMYEAIKPLATSGEVFAVDANYIVRLWAHEAFRLFQDRLVEVNERKWTDDLIDKVAKKHFSGLNLIEVLSRPILFSNWLSRNYVSVDQEELRKHVRSRLKVFNEEELDVKLVLFDEVLDHILRIDRVLRQPLGHLLLVGASGSGKTILSKFVAWMNGMDVFQIKVHKNYKAADFDKDLRLVLTRAGCLGIKIAFIFDESNVLDTSFLERMNALLASGEVPGLFEGADYANLLAECKEAARKDGLQMDTEEELYRRFLYNVQYNLHVIFTMNPANEDFENRAATSPALFNRCVIDWFGEWSPTAMTQVGSDFTKMLDMGDTTDPNFRRGPNDSEECTQREAVVGALVYMHESVRETMDKLAKAHGARSTFVTPRHFLDLLAHYNKFFNDKRSDLEEQQRHLNNGLRKLRETQDEVLYLREELTKKQVELASKSKLAGDKLELMMADKLKAEKQRDISSQIAEEIAQQDAFISERKQKVESELDQARPALMDAKQSVRGIKKTELDQVTRYNVAPPKVALAVEPVVIMLGFKADSWAGMKPVMRKADFIKSVLNFDVDTLDQKTVALIEKNYCSNPDFTYESVYHASKACGPLVKWVKSTLMYGKIKNSVAPLEAETKELAAKQTKLKEKAEGINKIMAELGQRITTLKSEYSILIAEEQQIRKQMEEVQTKVERSMSLLENLNVERLRWENDSTSFQEQISTVPGDCLLASAFIAYIGWFNQQVRQSLVQQWQSHLAACGVATKENLSLIEYLSHPSERLDWRAHSLPDDELCDENAIMIKRFNRYPLIIDPSGQAITFLMDQFADRKIVRTSFLDDAFLKHLESSLRFGNALLVEDVENIDPVLNSVLNREITRAGGRVMITVGDKEIDFSPSFTIFLSTRDPTCYFTPDLCSRVTFVNFTVTPSSLTSQCLSKVLKQERPDIDQKRSDMLKLQGAFRAQLRGLEEKLLTTLSEGKGKSILDDTKVMAALETLKSEAQEVQSKMDNSGKVMEEIAEVSNLYRSFAASSSAIYFCLEALADAHFLYQFSLPFFLQIVNQVLNDSSAHQAAAAAEQKAALTTDGSTATSRLHILLRRLLELTFARVGRGLLNKDRLAFALRLTQIALEDPVFSKSISLSSSSPSLSSAGLDLSELDFFMRGRLTGDRGTGVAGVPVPQLLQPLLGTVQQDRLKQLCLLPAFGGLFQSSLNAETDKWVAYVSSASSLDGETAIPQGWEGADATPGSALQVWRHMLVATSLRPDEVPALTSKFICEVLGPNYLSLGATIDLPDIVEREGSATTPFLFVSLPGFDASSKMDDLARLLPNKGYQSFAMGSPEGYELADKAIHNASKQGTWILLKNVHLSPGWLAALEKRLHHMVPHPHFRLFMAMELNPSVPANLVRLASTVIFEPPVGIKASLQRIFKSLNPKRVNRAPAERARLFLLLAWLHAVIIERLRYVPVGWTKAFGFSETDQRVAADALDEWIDGAGGERANLPPNKIPWNALRVAMEQVVYGGRVDNDFDQARLDAFVRALFTARAYDVDFPLASTYPDKADGKSHALLTLPEASNYEGFLSWIERLPEIRNPELLGLPANAERMLLTQTGVHMRRQLLQLQDEGQDMAVEDEVDPLSKSPSVTSTSSGSGLGLSTGDEEERKSSRPAWAAQLIAHVSEWSAMLPDSQALSSASQQPASGALQTLLDNPCYRCLSREFGSAAALLQAVTADLNSLKAVLSGKTKADNHVRSLFQALRADSLPAVWKKAAPGAEAKSLSPGNWLRDLGKRVHFLESVQKELKSSSSGGRQELLRMHFWLGGIMNPEAYVAATRQAVARAHNWSIEELALQVTFADSDGAGAVPADTFQFIDLRLHGAVWRQGALRLASDKDSAKLPLTSFTWRQRVEEVKELKENITLPVYFDGSRQNYLFSVTLPRPAQLPANIWSQRGVCLTVYHFE